MTITSPAGWRAERLRAPAERWLEVLDGEYLSDYLLSGGSTVKFVSGSDAALQRVAREALHTAGRYGFFTVSLDPSKLLESGKRPDVHRIDRFFFEVTREVDWTRWAGQQARGFLQNRGIFLSAGRELNDLDGIATDNRRDASDLLHEYQSEFTTPLLRDQRLSLEFRTALTALGRAQLIPDSMTPTTEEVLLGWFAGRTVPGASAALKKVRIFSRIDRSNARHMLASFCRWLPQTGRAGLVVVLDFRPYEQKRKTAAQRKNLTLEQMREAVARGASNQELALIVAEGDAEPPVTYTQAAYFQMLQMLRRFIDEIDWFERFCLVVLTSPGFYDETSDRHYWDYDALQTRIGLEVHDADRANPAAALVHLAEPNQEGEA